MKSILFLVLFSLSLVLAQPGGTPLASWAGSTINANTTWSVPSFSAPCTNTSNNSTYASFSVSFPTTHVRQVIALTPGSIYVFVYNTTFNPLNPCANYLVSLTDNNNVVDAFGPDVEDSFLFHANVTYVFVVSSTSATGYDFSVSIYDTAASGLLTATPTWSPVYLSSTGGCSQDSANVPFGLYVWTQNSSGLFDISVGFDYQSTWAYSYIALFNATVTATELASDTLCASTATTLVNGYYTSDRAVQLFGIQLNAGQTYSVVGSGSTATSIANYGFTVVPTRIAQPLFLATGFELPITGSGECSTVGATYTNQSFVASAFTAGSNNYKALVSLASLSSSYFTIWNTPSSDYDIAVIYNGLNVGSNTTAPTSCPANAPFVAAITSFPASFDIVPTQQYSTVAAYWATGSGLGQYNAYVVYAAIGAPAGNVNTSVGTSTGAASSTGSGATGATGGGGIGGQTHTSGNVTVTTGSATTVACSFVFVALAIMMTMF